MLPVDDRRGGRAGRARRREGLVPPERLEGRELLAYTPLGGSLPDLTVSGFAGPVGAYGGPLTITVDVRNLGASSLAEPLNLTQSSASLADAPPSSVGVFLAPQAGARAVLIGAIDVPTVRQNSIVRVSDTVTIPDAAALGRRFPEGGGTLFLTLRADDGRVVQEVDERNNRTADEAIPVRVAQALPDLEAVGLDLPPNLNPGDAIRANIEVANFGAVPSNQQGPVTVFLVASQDPFFGPGDAILDTFLIDNIPGLSEAPTRRLTLGDANLDNPPNIVARAGTVVNLPTSPESYFLGLIVDPNDTIREISELDDGPDPRLQLARFVAGPSDDLLADPAFPAPASPANRFPIPPFGPIFDVAPTTGLAAGRDPINPVPGPTPPSIPILRAQASGGVARRGRSRRSRP